ncbi:MAG TPA: DnaJ C-terminal domain-containing protein [Ktedonobacteraceae bacterium]
MGFQDQQSGDIHATLAVSQEEARLGSSRVINLPDGRTTTVVVPAGTRNGLELRLAGQGSMNSLNGSSGDLILRVSVVPSGGQRVEEDYATERAIYSSPADMSEYAGSGNRPGWSAPTPATPSGAIFASTPTDAGSPAQPRQQPYVDYGPTVPPRAQPQPYPDYGRHQNAPVYNQATPQQPYPYPDYNTPAYNQATAPGYSPPSARPTKPKPGKLMTVLILGIVVLLIVGSGLAFYLGYYQPGQQHGLATQTAQGQVSATARAAATGTAQVAQGTANAVATGTAQVQATVQAYQSIYTHATSGTPALDDPLSTPSLTSLWTLTLGSPSSGGCTFTGGSYHSTITNTGYFQPCYALSTNYSNFAYQVNMTIVQGDFGGLLFRANNAHNKFYLFRVGVDGSFALYNYANTQGAQASLLLSGNSKAVKGLNQSNEITVVAQHSAFYFFINRQYAGSVTDSTYSGGEVGVFGESITKSTDVAFNHAKVWTLS